MDQCENPCDIEKCAPNAICNVKMHRPICSCPEGHGGNPTVKCIPVQTRKDITTNFFNKNNLFVFALELKKNKIIICD